MSEYHEEMRKVAAAGKEYTKSLLDRVFEEEAKKEELIKSLSAPVLPKLEEKVKEVSKEEEDEAVAAAEEWLEAMGDDNVKPIVQFGGSKTMDVSTADALNAIKEYNGRGSCKRRPQLFRRDGKFARVAINDIGESYIQVLNTVPLVKNELLRIASWYIWSERKQTFVPSQPSDQLVSNIMAEPDFTKQCPQIVGITDIPLMSHNGSIMKRKGFDEATGIYYNGRYKLDVPEVPTAEDIKAAGDLIEEVFCDFPVKYDDKSSRTNMMAALITAVLRTFFDNPPPMFTVNKNMVGVGGSKVSKVISIVAVGTEDPKMMGWSTDDEEIRKKITTGMMNGDKIFIFDNVSSPGPIQSDALARLITSNTWGDRALGSNTDVAIPNQTVVIMNGNNVQLVSDLARRTVPIRLSTDNPEYTTINHQWKHDPLEAWVVKERHNLIRAVYVLYRGWLNAGKPKPAIAMASFEQWLHVVGGMLEITGRKHLLLNKAEESIDTGMDELVRMIDWVRESGMEKAFTSSAITTRMMDERRRGAGTLTDALPDEIVGLPDSKIALMIGRWLTSVCDKPSKNGYKFSKKKEKASGGKVIWYVAPNANQTTLT